MNPFRLNFIPEADRAVLVRLCVATAIIVGGVLGYKWIDVHKVASPTVAPNASSAPAHS